jgi:hypothetical protein
MSKGEEGGNSEGKAHDFAAKRRFDTQIPAV